MNDGASGVATVGVSRTAVMMCSLFIGEVYRKWIWTFQ
jgi:hypothetical protein